MSGTGRNSRKRREVHERSELIGEAIGGALGRDDRLQLLLQFGPERHRLADDAAAGPVEDERGRPRARTKATETFRRWCRASHGDPGMMLMERVFSPTKALASELGAEAWDVYRAQSEWAIRILPYFWSTMPAELKLKQAGYLAVAIDGRPGSLRPGDRVVDAAPFEALLKLAANQGLSDPVDLESNGAESNGAAETPAKSGA